MIHSDLAAAQVPATMSGEPEAGTPNPPFHLGQVTDEGAIMHHEAHTSSIKCDHAPVQNHHLP